MTFLHALLIDDDPESLKLLVDSLPIEIEGHEVRWEPCGDFDEAIQLLKECRYDVIVTDVYRDSASKPKEPATGDPKADDIVKEIREKRFSPILVFTDGTFPDNYTEGPLLKMADKSRGNDEIVSKLAELVATGIPTLARELHDDLDRSGGSYLWGFVEDNWASLAGADLTEPEILRRLLRRRASTQLGRLGPGGVGELKKIEGAEFYLHPPLADELRLGEVLVGSNDDYRVVLTPHCHLVAQPGAEAPRADYVLTVRTIEARDLFEKHPFQGDAERKLGELRRRIQSPAGFGKPAGRYWFLPGLLNMPHRFADFLQVESVAFERLRSDYQSFAVLDVPFAEAMQSCFVGFYSAVGLPALNTDRFTDLIDG